MNRLRQTDRAWIIRWTFGTVCGWIIGVIVVALIGTFLRVLTMQDRILHAMIVGAFVGYLQWRLALKDVLNRKEWTYAVVYANTLIVLVILFTESYGLFPHPFSFYILALCDPCNPITFPDMWFSFVLMRALISGVVAALPTAFVLYRHGFRIFYWVVGCILAFLVENFLEIPFALNEDLRFLWPPFFIGPLVIALILGPFLYVTLHDPLSDTEDLALKAFTNSETRLAIGDDGELVEMPQTESHDDRQMQNLN